MPKYTNVPNGLDAGQSRINRAVDTITGARTLTAEESGTWFIITGAANGITLPAVASGLTYEFAIASSAITATTATAALIVPTDTASTYVNAPGLGASATVGKGLIMSSASGTGAWAKLVCDGTDWWALTGGTWAEES